MNALQNFKRSMFYATTQVLDNNLPLFENVTELATVHQQLKEKTILIDQHRQVQLVKNTGLTRNKVTLRDELTTLLLRISTALTAHAAASTDQVLQAKVEYSHSELKKSSDRILCDIAVQVNGLAAAAGAALQTWFVGPDELARFTQLTNEFKTVLPLRRVASNVSKASTSDINEVFHEIDALLRNKVDLLLKPFKFTEPSFYKEYRNARAMVNYTGRRKAGV